MNEVWIRIISVSDTAVNIDGWKMAYSDKFEVFWRENIKNVQSLDIHGNVKFRWNVPLLQCVTVKQNNDLTIKGYNRLVSCRCCTYT
jgi:hypothetical protein